MLSFRCPVEPIPVPRARLTSVGGRPRAYTAPKYREWLKEVGGWFDAEYAGTPLTTPLLVDLRLCVEKPKTGKLAQPKGDIDNFAKGPLDAANGRIWVDDSQVSTLTATKLYVPHGTPGHFVMTVVEI